MGFTFPEIMPEVFTVEFEQNGKSYTNSIKAGGAAEAIKQAAPAKELTLHFIYSDKNEFILKVHFERIGDSQRHDGELWPDETTPTFAAYKELVRSAYDGNVDKVKKLMSEDTPFFWHNEPISLTPLEWTARWNHIAAFKALYPLIPDDYPEHNFAHCIKLAAQDDNSEILEMLVAHKKAKEITSDSLPLIFNYTCSFAKKLSSLQTILKHFNIGDDFRASNSAEGLLSQAVESGDLEVARWLIKHDVSRNIQDKDGRRLIDIAKSAEMKTLLTETGQQNTEGITFLANDLNKEHKFLFGKISHTLPSEIFKSPRSIARLINPGITEEYRFEENENASVVLVITKIRKDYPKDDSLLDKVTPSNKAMQNQFGKDVVLLRTASKEKPRIEEMIFLNAEYDHTSFPYGMGATNPNRELECLGISIMFVQNELLVECAMHLKKAKQETKEAFIKRAQDLCLKWQKTIKSENTK